MHSLKKMPNGFTYLELDNDVMQAKIALQGAHIFEFNKLLWLSEMSEFKVGVAIRGGIPLCWPRFGSLDTNMPQHGFARTQMFELLRVEEKSNKLTLVHMLTQALHSYFNVSDIDNISIKGLENRYYYDALRSKKELQKGEIKIEREIDRVYEGVDKDIVLQDEDKVVVIKAKNSASAIVWNPWIEKTKRMSGMKSNAYREFVCIESANAFDDFKIIDVGKAHTLEVCLSYFER